MPADKSCTLLGGRLLPGELQGQRAQGRRQGVHQVPDRHRAAGGLVQAHQGPARQQGRLGRPAALGDDPSLEVFKKQMDAAKAGPSLAKWTEFAAKLDAGHREGHAGQGPAEQAAEDDAVQHDPKASWSRSHEHHDRKGRAAGRGAGRAGRPPQSPAAGPRSAGAAAVVDRRAARCRLAVLHPLPRPLRLFMAFPILATLLMSFTDFGLRNVTDPSRAQFVGFENYTQSVRRREVPQVAVQHGVLRGGRRSADDRRAAWSSRCC